MHSKYMRYRAISYSQLLTKINNKQTNTMCGDQELSCIHLLTLDSD